MTTNLKPDTVTSRSIVSNAASNLIGQLIPLLAAVVCIPLIISGLGVDRFGVLNLAWVIVGYFSFLDFGLGRALTHLVAKRKSQHEDSTHLIWFSVCAIGTLGIVAGVATHVLAPWLVDHVFVIPKAIRQEAIVSLVILGWSTPLVIVGSCLRGVLEGLHQFKIINLLRAPLGIFMYASPLLALQFSDSLIYPVALIFLARFINTVVFGYYCQRFFPLELSCLGKVDIIAIRGLVRVGGWLTVTNIVGPLMVYMDRFLVGTILSAAAVSYYATPFEMITKLLIVPAALTGVLFPSFSSYVKEMAKSEQLLQRSIKVVTLTIFPVIFIIVGVSSEILSTWLGQDFVKESDKVLKILAGGVFINSIAQVTYTFLQGAGRPDVTAKMHIVELFIYIPSVFYLTSVMGIEGTAIAWTGRIFLDAVILTCLTNKIYGFAGIDWLQLLVLLLSIVMLFLVSLPHELITRLLILLLYLVIFGCIYWQYLLDRQEKEMLMQLIGKKGLSHV